MKLITAPIKKALESTPHLTHDGKNPADVPVIAKFFLPVGRFSYYVTECETVNNGNRDDYHFYGFCVSPMGSDCDELGYMSLEEMTAIRVMGGLGIERDMHWTGSLLDAFKANGFTRY